MAEIVKKLTQFSFTEKFKNWFTKIGLKTLQISTFIAVCMTSNGLKKQFVVVSLNKYLESILD